MEHGSPPPPPVAKEGRWLYQDVDGTLVERSPSVASASVAPLPAAASDLQPPPRMSSPLGGGDALRDTTSSSSSSVAPVAAVLPAPPLAPSVLRDGDDFCGSAFSEETESLLQQLADDSDSGKTQIYPEGPTDEHDDGDSVETQKWQDQSPNAKTNAMGGLLCAPAHPRLQLAQPLRHPDAHSGAVLGAPRMRISLASRQRLRNRGKYLVGVARK